MKSCANRFGKNKIANFPHDEPRTVHHAKLFYDGLSAIYFERVAQCRHL
jgi:hypothetical protein